jgi:hypothetical protein
MYEILLLHCFKSIIATRSYIFVSILNAAKSCNIFLNQTLVISQCSRFFKQFKWTNSTKVSTSPASCLSEFGGSWNALGHFWYHLTYSLTYRICFWPPKYPKNHNEWHTVTELKKIIISLHETITYVHWVICYTFHSRLTPSCIPFFCI